MNLPTGVIILWPSTNGSIPTGFSRVTALDGKYPKGANGVNQNTTGGATTHTHASPAHHHDLQSHQHTFTIPDITDLVQQSHTGTPPGLTTEMHHTHNGTTPANAQPG